MAKAKQLEVAVIEPIPVPQLCGNCKEWKVNSSAKSFGQCMLSGKFGSAPLVTLDRASCSSWHDL